MTNRTSAYRFTTTDLNSQLVQETRKLVKILNAQQRVRELETGKPQRRYKLAFKGRLGENNPYAALYRRGGPEWRYSCQTIRREHATRFDVYMYDYYRDWTRDPDYTKVA